MSKQKQYCYSCSLSSACNTWYPQKYPPCFSQAALEHLRSIIPETYGDAIVKYKWLKCEPHEWDNRTYLENVEYVLIEASALPQEREHNPSSPKLPELSEVKKEAREWFDAHMNIANPSPGEIVTHVYLFIAGKIGR